MYSVDATAQTLNRLTMALDGAVDSLLAPLQLLVLCFIAGSAFALCALACYRARVQYFPPWLGSETFRRKARLLSVAGFLGLTCISALIFLQILFGSGYFD